MLEPLDPIKAPERCNFILLLILIKKLNNLETKLSEFTVKSKSFNGKNVRFTKKIEKLKFYF